VKSVRPGLEDRDLIPSGPDLFGEAPKRKKPSTPHSAAYARDDGADASPPRENWGSGPLLDRCITGIEALFKVHDAKRDWSRAGRGKSCNGRVLYCAPGP